MEVKCKSSGKIRRFAEGTDAGFAVSLINRKLDNGAPKSLLIEAIKEGEEPISFGPNSLLVNYGDGWKLHTVTEIDFAGFGKFLIGFNPFLRLGIVKSYQLLRFGVEFLVFLFVEGAGIGNGEGLVRPRTVRVGNVNVSIYLMLNVFLPIY